MHNKTIAITSGILNIMIRAI